MTPLLEAVGLTRRFGAGLLRRQVGVTAVADVSLRLMPGESVGIVGESGSGKSTLGRLLLGLIPPSSGVVRYRGQPLGAALARDRRGVRRALQIVQQDPTASLDPRWDVARLVREGLDIHGLGTPAERAALVAGLLADVGLDAGFAARRPHELSGGQKQRVAIARALALAPDFLFADEPVSALDVSVRAQVLGLLNRLRAARGIGLLMVSHDIAAVAACCDRILVMQAGRIVEDAPRATLLRGPRHPHTRDLLAAVPPPPLALAAAV
ncbi:ATP-binding cassette domain-containing protein [Roseomonas sp. F4]